MPAAPLLLDVATCCDEHTDAALEALYKAMGEDPPDADIWAPHPNPFVRRIVELFTQRGLDRIDGARAELSRWIRGEEHSPADAPARPEGAMRRWGQAELGATRTYLRHLPPTAWQLDDWMMLVDYLVQRYLPEADLRAESDWLVTRSALMGRVQAKLDDVTEAEADTLLAELPGPTEVRQRWGMTPAQEAAITYGRARCAEHVTALADSARHRIRGLIVEHQEAVFLGNRAETSEDLQTKLLDAFGTLNRDWRRIAVTEATENVNQGVVAATPAGGRLRRVERYHGACAFCREIDGREVTVVSPSKPGKNGDAEIWLGKTNIGRSASPRRRLGGALVDREPHERWWIAAGAQHPNCRGRWVQAAPAVAADPEFEAWLQSMKRGRG